MTQHRRQQHDPRNGPLRAEMKPSDPFLVAAAAALGLNADSVARVLNATPQGHATGGQRQRGHAIEEREERLGVGAEKLTGKDRLRQARAMSNSADGPPAESSSDTPNEGNDSSAQEPRREQQPHVERVKLANTEIRVLRKTPGGGTSGSGAAVENRKRARQQSPPKEEAFFRGGGGASHGSSALGKGARRHVAATAEQERMQALMGNKRRK